MQFNSIEYLSFFPVTVIIYMILPQKVKNIWLLVASYFFYMSWNKAFGLLLLSVTILSYLGAFITRKHHNKIVLCGILVPLIGVLFYFKYYNFVMETVKSLVHYEFEVTSILLPMGISFYVFQSIAYVADVYKGRIDPEKSIVNYALFISFFPQLVAGPIERAENMLVQFRKAYKFNYRETVNGLIQITYGLFQKIVIADRVAIIANTVFNDYEAFPGVTRAIAMLAFSLQIYCDFAGYSNIAIGSARVMGFDLMQNFNNPYNAISFGDFWHRWHISLSQWFRDYVYIPLGGNRGSIIRTNVNTMIVMLLSGIWHGAGWNFVVWGGIHGVYLVAEKDACSFFRKIGYEWKKTGIVLQLKRISVFLFVSLAWVFFRSASVRDAVQYIRGMISQPQFWLLFSAPESIITSMGTSLPDIMILVVAVLFMIFIDKNVERTNWFTLIEEQTLLERWLIYLGLVLAIVVFGFYGYDWAQTEFIYFQF